MSALPGMLVNKVSVFELNVGDRVYDKDSDRTGIVSDIKETSPEWIEAFITLDGSDKEIPALDLPYCVILKQEED